MIKRIFKTLTNSVLVVLLLGMLILPITSMGIMKFKENSTVLSAEDEREQVDERLNIDRTNVPDEVEEVIMRLEREYYQSSGSAPTQE